MSTGERNRYTRRQKARAVIAAELTSPTQAAEASGIPRTTLIHWMDDPEMVELRLKTREELADDVRTLAHVALGTLVARIRAGDIEATDWN